QIVRHDTPQDLAVIERSKDGNFYGYIVDVLEHGQSIVGTAVLRDVLAERMQRAVQLNEQASALQQGAIGSINYQLNRLRLERRGLELEQQLTAADEQRIQEQQQELQQRYQELEQKLFSLREEANRDIGRASCRERGQEAG